MPARPPHPAALPADELYHECQCERLRRSGPGGQHRNKVETAIRLRHNPTGISAEASERRSQEQNRRRALQRLRINLALAVRLPVPVGSEPNTAWQSRLRNGRIHVNPDHDDFAIVLAEALDFLAASGGDVASAAGQLGCSSSQLVKLLKAEPRALEKLNQERRAQGRPPLR